MRSRAARLTLSAVACIALGAAAGFLIHSEKQISARRMAVRALDLHAREVIDAIADARAGQQAYVAAGQGVAFWMPKVDALLDQIGGTVDTLRASAASADARKALLEAAAAVTEFGNVDRRAREYVRSGDTLMAGDVVFTEGGEVASAAARGIEAARLAEHQAFDASEAAERRLEASVVGGAAGMAVLILLILALVPVRAEAAINETTPSPEAPPAADRPRGSAPALRAAADLCTEFGRINDLNDLTRLLGRAADLMDASGLIVWLSNGPGGDLRPVLAHGYTQQTLARIPAIPRSADNAAAAAYRSGLLQIVMARPGTSQGAVVAPLVAAEGCVGALTAEIRDRGETSDAVQALAAIVAAQLTGVLAASAAPSVPATTVDKAASA